MLPAHLPPAVRAAVLDAKAALEALYGDRLVRLVLYGSHARGEAHAGSDVDLLVVLRGPVRDYDELKRTWAAVYRDGAPAETAALSFALYSEATFADPGRPFVCGVRAEGVEV